MPDTSIGTATTSEQKFGYHEFQIPETCLCLPRPDTLATEVALPSAADHFCPDIRERFGMDRMWHRNSKARSSHFLLSPTVRD